MQHYVNRPCAVQGYDELTCGQYLGLIHRAIIDGELNAAEYYLSLARKNNAIHEIILAAKEIRAEHQQQVKNAADWDEQTKTKYGVSNPFNDTKRSGTYAKVLPNVSAPPKKKMFP